MVITIRSANPETTEAIGRWLAGGLAPGVVLALYGSLGAGKTALCRGIARGLGVTEPVTSPTFTVVQEYLLRSDLRLYHLDMYRIDDEAAALAFGIEEYLFAPSAIALVEWPERIEGLLEWGAAAGGGGGPPSCLLRTRLEHVDDHSRDIAIPASLMSRCGRSGLPADAVVLSASTDMEDAT